MAASTLSARAPTARADSGRTEGAATKSGAKADLATIGGLILAVGGIVAGLLAEGGKIQDVAQITAAMIVIPGTLGAVMITTPVNVLLRAFRRLPQLFFYPASTSAGLLEEILKYAAKARKEGIVSLEQDAESAKDPFLRKAMNLAVDGTDIQQIRKIMDLEIALLEREGEAESKVFDAAGGYAPTIGIIGAVLGLIQVMKNLANIDEVGRGIAVAFVATIYGVGAANIFFLPAANKLRARSQTAVEARELILEGVVSIAEGMHPKLIRSQLEAYVTPAGHTVKTPGKGKAPFGRSGGAQV